MRGILREAQVLLGLRLHLLQRGTRRSGRARRGINRRLLILPVVALAVSLSFSLSLTRALATALASPQGRLVLAPLLTWLSSSVTLLLFLMAIPTVLATFTYSSDLRLLLLTPLSPRLVLGEKLAALYASFVALLALVGVPLLLAVGRAAGFGLGYALMALLMVALLPLGPIAVAMVITVAVLRWVPPARARSVVAILGALIGIGAYVGSQVLASQTGVVSVDDLRSLVDPSLRPWWSLLPSAWPGRALGAAAQGDAVIALTYLALTLLLVAVLCAGAILLSAALFTSGWATYQEVGRRRVGRGRRSSSAWRTDGASSAAPQSMARASTTAGRSVQQGGARPPAVAVASILARCPIGQRAVIALLGKEWRVLRRDPQVWARLLYPLFVAVFGLYRALSQSNNPGDAARIGYTGGASWLFGSLVFVTCFLVSFLALPLINREGRALSLLALAPLSTRAVLLVKWTFCAGPVLLLIEGILWLGGGIVGASLSALLCAAVAYGALIVALSGVLLLLSLIWPRLDWDNPRRQISVQASLLGAVSALILGAGTAFGLLYAIAMLPDDRGQALLALLGIVAVSLILSMLVAVAAPQRLDDLLHGER